MSRWSAVLFHAYRCARCRRLCRKLVLRLEGGQSCSATLRWILAAYHGVEAGAYSYGDGLTPGVFPPGVVIGSYVSIASDTRVLLRNHPLERLSLHPFFYNQSLHYVSTETIPSGRLVIEADAWLGERAIVTPRCGRIGLGAVGGAGAVVTKDVPDFAIVAGNPAQLIRFRFDEDTQQVIRASRWWELPIQECARHIGAMVEPLGSCPAHHPLLRAAAQDTATERIRCN